MRPARHQTADRQKISNSAVNTVKSLEGIFISLKSWWTLKQS